MQSNIHMQDRMRKCALWNCIIWDITYLKSDQTGFTATVHVHCTAGESNVTDDNLVVAKLAGEMYHVHSYSPKADLLSTPQMIQSYGHECEELDVTTEDNYILKLFHIKGNCSADPPILILHGFLDSSDSFLIRGKDSLAINLTESGYDVWLGNARGNRYSRRHVFLDPDADEEYWDFTFQENGYYDNPALIDFVLSATGRPQLVVVGHSQGTLNQFIACATRPQYNAKVKVFIALAPIFFTEHYKGLSVAIKEELPAVYTAFKASGEKEILSQNSTLRSFFEDICTKDKGGYFLCTDILFGLFGADSAGLEPDFFPTAIGHFFAGGASIKIILHLYQLLNNRQGWFDYDPAKNLEKYHSIFAPLFDVSKVTGKIVLMAGKNDFVGNPEDSMALRDHLPNAEYFEMPYIKFNHLDFVWGKYMNENFFPYIHKFLNKYK